MTTKRLMQLLGQKQTAAAQQTSKRRFAAATKALWVVAVLAAVTWYFVTNWDQLRVYALELGLAAVATSFASLTLGRVVIAAVSRAGVQMLGTDMRLSKSFYINTLAQLGKYAPGSVWHLVGQVALYRQHGLSTKRGSAVLAVENSVLLASGGLLGLALSLEPLAGLAGVELRWPEPTTALAFGAALVLWWLVAVRVSTAVLRRFGVDAVPHRNTLYWLAIAFWSCFGLAFWALLPPEARTFAMLPLATGTFAVAWVAGYLSPFAPAGIGVREAVIVALLGPLVGVPSAVGAAVASRILWTFQELGTAPLAAYKLSGLRAREPVPSESADG